MRFLNNIVPDHWNETVETYPECYACRVMGDPITEYEWEGVMKKLNDEFGDNIVKIHHAYGVYSIHGDNLYGKDITIFLKRNPPDENS
jgi:hypothetical protein